MKEDKPVSIEDLDNAIIESRIESGQNLIRHKHNDLESKKLFNKNYFPYESIKFLKMVSITSKFLNQLRENNERNY